MNSLTAMCHLESLNFSLNTAKKKIVYTEPSHSLAKTVNGVRLFASHVIHCHSHCGISLTEHSIQSNENGMEKRRRRENDDDGHIRNQQYVNNRVSLIVLAGYFLSDSVTLLTHDMISSVGHMHVHVHFFFFQVPHNGGKMANENADQLLSRI